MLEQLGKSQQVDFQPGSTLQFQRNRMPGPGPCLPFNRWDSPLTEKEGSPKTTLFLSHNALASEISSPAWNGPAFARGPPNHAWGQKVRPVLNPHCLATLTRESGPVRTCNLIFHLSQQFALPPLQHKKKLGNFFRPARRIRKFLQGPENRRGKEPAQSGQPPRQAGLRHPASLGIRVYQKAPPCGGA